MSRPGRRDILLFDRTALAVCLILLGGTILYPTLRLLVSAITQWQSDAVFTGAGFEAARNTLVIGFLSVLTSGIIGTALASLLARYAFPGRGALAGPVAAGAVILPTGHSQGSIDYVFCKNIARPAGQGP